MIMIGFIAYHLQDHHHTFATSLIKFIGNFMLKRLFISKNFELVLKESIIEKVRHICFLQVGID